MKNFSEQETKKYTEDGNAVIAEFCGMKKVTENGETFYISTGNKKYRISELKFHSDWNWTMRAIDAIEAAYPDPINGFKVIIGRAATVEGRAKKYYEDSSVIIEVNSFRRNRHQMTWKCILDFCNWRNKKIKKQSQV